MRNLKVTRTMDNLLPFTAILACCLRLTVGWCPKPNNALEDLVHFADSVVVGKVTEIIPDPSLASYEVPTYGATIDVRCSYKGGLGHRSIPETITIGEAGELSMLILCKSQSMTLLNNEKCIYVQFQKRTLGLTPLTYVF